MSGNEPKRRRTKAEIDGIVAKWRASGQSVPKFSSEHGVSASSLYLWVTKRRKGAQEGKLQHQPEAGLVESFTEVEVTGHVESKRGGALIIVTANGHTVMVGRDGVEADELRTVLSVVNGC